MASFSLWAMPCKGTVATQLQAEVDSLAAKHAGAPRFAPHVTLLPAPLLGAIPQSEAQVLAAATKLAAELQPYHIDFEKVTCGDIFHQCVFLLCKKDEATMRAGALTREAFGLDAHAPYMPHCSLLYSDMTPAEREEEAAAADERLMQGSGAAAAGIDIGSIAVWYTPVEDKSLQSWRLVQELPLGAALA